MIVKVKTTPTKKITATKLQLYRGRKFVVSQTKNFLSEMSHALTSCHDKREGTTINKQNAEILDRKCFCLNIPRASI